MISPGWHKRQETPIVTTTLDTKLRLGNALARQALLGKTIHLLPHHSWSTHFTRLW